MILVVNENTCIVGSYILILILLAWAIICQGLIMHILGCSPSIRPYRDLVNLSELLFQIRGHTVYTL